MQNLSRFDQIPSHIEAAQESVVLILLDGLGWHLFQRHRDHPLFRRAQSVQTLTSQFPSTTTAHMTTLHTGLPVSAHGVFEWLYREPALGRIFAPFPYTNHIPSGDSMVGLEPSALLPQTSFYGQLAERGVKSACIQPAKVTRSVYTRFVCRDATRIAHEGAADAMRKAKAFIEATTTRAHVLVYVDDIDARSHRTGPYSDDVSATVRGILDAIEAELVGFPSAQILLTADHGQVATDPTRTHYLDRLVEELPGWLEESVDGTPLAPAGGRRDLFLYVKPEHLERAQSRLTQALEGVAQVVRPLESGLFGENPSQRLTERMGTLLVLPEAGELVWWWGEEGRFEVRGKWGDHGGLSAEECEIPLLRLM